MKVKRGSRASRKAHNRRLRAQECVLRLTTKLEELIDNGTVQLPPQRLRVPSFSEGFRGFKTDQEAHEWHRQQLLRQAAEEQAREDRRQERLRLREARKQQRRERVHQKQEQFEDRRVGRTSVTKDSRHNMATCRRIEKITRTGSVVFRETDTES